jgi:hypothetical protein
VTTISCFYTCAECRTVRQHVDVPERDPATHDIIAWLQQVAVPALVADHKARSPRCTPREFAEVGIPVPPGTDNVGERVRS